MPPEIDPLSFVLDAVSKAARASGHTPEDVRIVAVSKQQGSAAITGLITQGQRVFGENRVQEAMEKWPPLKGRYPDIELHLIGPLQSNKAADAVRLFDVVETLDRHKIIDALAAEEQKQQVKRRYMIQVNTGSEAQKSGVAPQKAHNLYDYARAAGLTVTGLMCIPPVEEAPGLHFALLRKLAEDIGAKDLSMGMSADYETAVTFGATHVRIGTALFGAHS